VTATSPLHIVIFIHYKHKTMIHPSTKYLTSNAPKMSHPRTYRKKYINNNSVWPPKNVTTIQTNYPAHITDFMNTFQKCTKKFVRNISNLKPSLLVAFTVTENQVFSKLALFFYCNSGTDGGTVKSKESRGQNNQLRKSSNFHYGRWYNIHQKQNKIYFQYPWVAGHSQE